MEYSEVGFPACGFPPIPQPAGYPFKRRGSIKLNPDWVSKEVALKEEATSFKRSLQVFSLTCEILVRMINILSCLLTQRYVVVIPGTAVWGTGAFEQL